MMQQLCVAPLSSPYSLLPRAHTYALITALLIPLPRGWLFRAALAAFTTRTAIFAIDAAVILHAVSRTPGVATEPLPLDAIVVLEILGLAVIIACWLLLASHRVNESSARPLIRIWALVVTVGSILSFVSVARLGKLVAAGYSGVAKDGHCEGAWMDESDVFGDAEKIRVLGVMGSKIAWLEQRVGIPPLVFSAIAVIAIALPRERSLAAQRGGTEVTSEEIWGDGVVGIQKKSGPVKMLLSLLLCTAMPAMAILMVVSTEQYLYVKTSGLRSVEKMSSVGQWGVWVATGAVVLATLINAGKEKSGLGKASNVDVWREDGEIVKL